MNTQLNYHHLRYFLAVATEGGIKQASKALHVSPPTLSAQVRELERFLDAGLFLREGKAMILTDTGRVVKRYAERVFAFGDEMLEVVSRGEPGGLETVFVGLVDSVPKLLASRLLSRAWQELPGLRVVVREGQPSELFPALAAHQLDIVIATEQPPSTLKTVLFSRKTGRFAVHFVAAPSLKADFKPRNGLTGFPVLVPTRESALRRELDRWWADEGIKPDIRAEFDDSAAMCELAAAGIGAAPVLAPVLHDVKQRYGLAELPIRTGIHEELFVVTAERQFSHEGPRVIARVAGEVSGKQKAAPARGRSG
ncbi:MAG: LysR substrate-binding domain-containing protein [Terrimicrobiaceae bacterium]